MIQDDIRAIVVRALAAIAPEADIGRIRPDVSVRDQLDIDSMDFLNFVIALHKEFQMDIPESEYAKLSTIDACVNYLSSRLMHTAEACSAQKRV